jgi:prefoldin subunit 5
LLLPANKLAEKIRKKEVLQSQAKPLQQQKKSILNNKNHLKNLITPLNSRKKIKVRH